MKKRQRNIDPDRRVGHQRGASDAVRHLQRMVTDPSIKHVDDRFAEIAAAACLHRRDFPEIGDRLAELVTNFWLAHEQALRPTARALGESFSFLELPDAQVLGGSSLSVDERWAKLEDETKRFAAGELKN